MARGDVADGEHSLLAAELELGRDVEETIVGLAGDRRTRSRAATRTGDGRREKLPSPW